MKPPPSLEAEITALIAAEGPISLERYIGLALGHPSLGYYMTRDPFGAAGDFVTAPEISQMFGELLGLWASVMWDRMGGPGILHLVELGPGRGTLMADALRAAKAAPAFHAAVELHLVETSAVLRAAQRHKLSGSGVPVFWHDDLSTVPDGPALVLANEFFDALPVRHYIRAARGWHERVVGLDGDHLTFGLSPDSEPSLTAPAPSGATLEVGLAARRWASALGARLACDGGAALILDYGYGGPRFGETLQAVRAHRFVDPLEAPGEADLTTHVDFVALRRAAEAEGVKGHGPRPQGEFLRRLGLRERADRLKRRADPGQAEAIDAAVARLAGAGTPERPGMGELFKVLAFTGPGLPSPPGFEEDSPS